MDVITRARGLDARAAYLGTGRRGSIRGTCARGLRASVRRMWRRMGTLGRGRRAGAAASTARCTRRSCTTPAPATRAAAATVRSPGSNALRAPGCLPRTWTSAGTRSQILATCPAIWRWGGGHRRAPQSRACFRSQSCVRDSPSCLATAPLATQALLLPVFSTVCCLHEASSMGRMWMMWNACGISGRCPWPADISPSPRPAPSDSMPRRPNLRCPRRLRSFPCVCVWCGWMMWRPHAASGGGSVMAANVIA